MHFDISASMCAEYSIRFFPYIKKGPILIIVDQLFVIRSPVFLLRVIGRISFLQSINPLLGNTGNLLLAAEVAKVGNNGNQPAGTHTPQVFIPFNKNRIGAAPGCRYSRPDTAGAAADDNDVSRPADAGVPDSFPDSFPRYL